MEIFNFLKVSLLILLLFECDGARNNPETYEASTSRNAAHCECGDNQLSELKTIKLKLNKQREAEFKISRALLAEGGFGKVYHAYWPDRDICVAIKKIATKSKKFIKEEAKNEIAIFEYINGNIEQNNRTYIIKMYGYQKLPPLYKCWKPKNIYIVMELGGMSLYDYFEHNDKVIKEEDGGREIFSERRQELLTNIFKCAAKALQQFHEFAIHLDIKGINFVITKGQNPDNPLEMCKLIDFNSSIISKDNEHKIVKSLAGYRFALAPEIEEIANKGLKVNRKVDVWAFGIMMITMMSFRVKNPDRDPNLVNANELNLPEQILEYKHIIEHDLETYIQKASFNTNLDLALKGCMHPDPNNRLSMNQIVDILGGN